MTIESISMLSYLIAAIFFILALRGLSSPTSARSGNLFGIVGMIIAVLTTLWTGNQLVPLLIFAPLILGGGIGIYVAKKVEMTKMPELVSLFNGMGGACAALIGLVEFHHYVGDSMSMSVILGAFIGAITFTASVIAFGKLSGKFGAKPTVFRGQHVINFIINVYEPFWVMDIVFDDDHCLCFRCAFSSRNRWC